ncbi:chemotaxis protein CheX [Marinitoga aeolica]|uniref:Chemotaxis protein CheX n=1 Tax=Marinitoga aeolica TaxID=2809031 RepID=A0ABY8PN79_9BACT|nr:chemotaxis protein CheX [Marinitoga aeolica]WGS64102.1 chemotaxis protein CheX [Marinitoga aeolica]
MNVKVINSILDAFSKTFKMATNNMDIVIQKPVVDKGDNRSYEVVVTIGFIGDLDGNIHMGLSVESAKVIVSQMMMGMPVEKLDEMSLSALGELGNMISGSIAINLEKLGYKINITPPSIMHGNNIIFIKDGISLRFPMNIDNKFSEEFFVVLKSSI